jgi:hypothetical protein
MQTYTSTLTSASVERTFGVADYSDAVIRISGIWDGSIAFYATNTGTAYTAIAVQELDSTNWTTAVTSEAGSSPSAEVWTARVPVAGLTTLVVKSEAGFSGSVDLVVTAVSNTNAR